jgi:hypothetical protein
MTRTSKIILLLSAAFLFLTEGSFAAMDSKVFDVVPSGDPAYGQLKQLEEGGLLPYDSTQAPLTRFEVAEKISDAQQKLKEIVVAQADMELPPPPGDGTAAVISVPASPSDSTAAPAQTTPVDDKPLWNNPQKIQAAEQALTSLQDAYNLELQLVKDQKTDLTDQLSQAEEDQYGLWKMVKSVQDNPSVSIHGLGRALGISQQYYGSYSGFTFTNPSTRNFFGYLDLEPTGAVSKELTFDGIIRLGTYALPDIDTTASTSGTSADYLVLRRISATFSPDFMTATVGDFYESYTPFTIWNRNNLDLVYVPEAVGRWDDIQKYESFFNQEPDWPFRGLRIGTQIDWPNSRVLGSFKVSTFANIIDNAFDDATKNVTYYGYGTAYQYTGWTLGAEAELKSKKFYLGETSWQIALDDYLVVLEDQWGTQEPVTTPPQSGSYSATNPATWAHQYVINSYKPSLRVGLGGDVYFGVEGESAFSNFQDNVLNSATSTSDFALNIEPYLQMGDSKITVHYLNVGPYFYSPLAQTRQDNNSLTPNYSPDTGYQPGVSGYVPGFGLFQSPILSQFFLQNVPRAGGIFGYYDRTLDNTFPYGLATPNREGVGLEVDIETLKKKSLKIKGSAYLVQEITGNSVVNSTGTGFATLDPTSSGAIPVRNFTYINFGPSFDFGPNIGLDTPLEIGTNVRYEQTTSVVGTLNSLGLWTGVRVGIVKEWEVNLALGVQSANGTEEGINGSTLARYSYVFDNTDLGSYKAFTVNDSVGYYLLSTSFRFDRNSTLYLDYDLSSGNDLATVGQISGTLQNQFIGMSYEVKF